MLKDVGMSDCELASAPLPKGLKLSIDEGDIFPELDKFRRLIGRLLYVNITRPDISYSVQCPSQFMSSPRKPHQEAALHLLKYLRSCPLQGLFFPAQSEFQLASCLL